MAIPQRLCKKEGQKKEREREKVKREKRGDRTEGRCSTLEMWGWGGRRMDRTVSQPVRVESGKIDSQDSERQLGQRERGRQEDRQEL